MHNYILHFRFDHIITNTMTADCSVIRGKVTFVKTEVIILITIHLRIDFILRGDFDKMLNITIPFKTLEKMNFC